jgi:hypothetical protein
MHLSQKQWQIGIGMILALLSGLLSHTYRPYIYQNQIDDFHIADTLGNIFAVPAATLFLTGIQLKTTKTFKVILAMILGFVLYEFISLTFDIYDIIATILSGGITYIILNFLGIKEL